MNFHGASLHMDSENVGDLVTRAVGGDMRIRLIRDNGFHQGGSTNATEAEQEYRDDVVSVPSE